METLQPHLLVHPRPTQIRPGSLVVRALEAAQLHPQVGFVTRVEYEHRVESSKVSWDDDTITWVENCDLLAVTHSV
jgi:hypothetical protein